MHYLPNSPFVDNVTVPNDKKKDLCKRFRCVFLLSHKFCCLYCLYIYIPHAFLKKLFYTDLPVVYTLSLGMTTSPTSEMCSAVASYLKNIFLIK